MPTMPDDESDSDFRRIADEAVKKAKDQKEGLVDEVLGILTGHITQRPPYVQILANTILGVALGAQTDLGHSDERILRECEELLAKIRRARDNPSAMKALEDLKNEVR